MTYHTVHNPYSFKGPLAHVLLFIEHAVLVGGLPYTGGHPIPPLGFAKACLHHFSGFQSIPQGMPEKLCRHHWHHLTLLALAFFGEPLQFSPLLFLKYRPCLHHFSFLYPISLKIALFINFELRWMPTGVDTELECMQYWSGHSNGVDTILEWTLYWCGHSIEVDTILEWTRYWSGR